jgi:subtilisin family serine protease
MSVAAVLALVAGGLALSAPSASAGTAKTATAKAAAQHPQGAGRYIVTFADEPAASYEGTVAGYPRTRPDAGKKLDPTRAEVISWRAHLTSVHDDALRAAGATKFADYTVATNGVAVDVTAAQATALARTAGVLSLEKDALRTPDAVSPSSDFLQLGASGGLWSKLDGQSNAGRGVIIGVIDTGIWPESPSFAGSELKRDAAGLPVPASGLRGQWFGPCVQGEQFNSQNCNDKLIGARYYVDGFGKQDIAKGEYLSPRDGAGHGSHTSSTAAGNVVSGVSIDGTPMGTVSGMAPGARLAMYKVCWEARPGATTGCTNSDSIAAIDDAVADGVDVLNYSIGGTTESSPLDSVEQAFRRASNMGIFVANSAGNSGPGASTLDHPSPWLTTAAASTFQITEQAIQLGNGQRFVGASTTGALPAQTPFVSAASVKLASAAAADAALCFAGTLDPAKTAGKFVQCDRGVNARIDKSFEVKRAGGVAMVLTNVSPNSLDGDFHAVPTVHVPVTARGPILSYIANAGAAATAAIVAVNPGESTTKIPEVAEFSSRGPSTTTGGDILKPDIAAPGVSVLAAVAPPFNHGRSYDFLSGTSMASPHIAGLGALIKALHPTWSPAAVKSALMTTARDHASSADPFAQGAGFVQPNGAADPGLVFDAAPNDFRSYMVSLGVHFAAPFDTLPPVSGSDLNQASLAVGSLAGTRAVTRTVTNVSTVAEKYTVTSSVLGLSVAASPASFTVAAGAKQAVRFTLTRSTAVLGSWAKGSITLKSKTHTVRIPVAVRPVAIKAPAEISGTGASGSKTFSVTPGSTTSLSSTVTGLVGATPQPGSVSNGPFAPPAVGAATKAFDLVVPTGTTLARFDVDAANNADDLDLYVYQGSTLVDLSASASGDEQVTLTAPAAGTYTAYVNGFDTAAGGGVFRFTGWAVPSGPAVPANLTVAPNPASATIGVPLDLTATWSGLDATKRWLGYIEYSGATDRTIVSIG